MTTDQVFFTLNDNTKGEISVLETSIEGLFEIEITGTLDEKWSLTHKVLMEGYINHPPVITKNLANMKIRLNDHSKTILLSATDANNDDLTFSLNISPQLTSK